MIRLLTRSLLCQALHARAAPRPDSHTRPRRDRLCRDKLLPRRPRLQSGEFLFLLPPHVRHPLRRPVVRTLHIGAGAERRRRARNRSRGYVAVFPDGGILHRGARHSALLVSRGPSSIEARFLTFGCQPDVFRSFVLSSCRIPCPLTLTNSTRIWVYWISLFRYPLQAGAENQFLSPQAGPYNACTNVNTTQQQQQQGQSCLLSGVQVLDYLRIEHNINK